VNYFNRELLNRNRELFNRELLNRNRELFFSLSSSLEIGEDYSNNE